MTLASEEPSALRGAVLRAWREYSGVKVRELADRLQKSPGTVSMWETGKRGARATASLPKVADIAVALDLAPDETQAFSDMWLAAATVTAAAPRTHWAHNYQWPSGPGWVWLRCPAPPASLAVKGWWSEPLQGRLDMQVGAGGVFVQFPATIPNPPLELEFDDPGGWADFGKGRVPPGVAEQFGALVLDPRTLAVPVTPTVPPLKPFMFQQLRPYIRPFQQAARVLGIGWALLAPHFGIARWDLAPHPAEDSQAGRAPEQADVAVDGLGRIISQLSVEPGRLRLSRDARGLSREAVAARVTELDQVNPLSAAVLRAYEENGIQPSVTRLISRLDTTYGADGNLGLDVVYDSRHGIASERGIKFPRYWQGPVWLQLQGPQDDAVGLVELVWGPWRRRQYVHSRAVLTTRKAAYDMSPLACVVTDGWYVVAGVGAVPWAVDINHGWYPKSAAAAIGLIVAHLKAVSSR